MQDVVNVIQVMSATIHDASATSSAGEYYEERMRVWLKGMLQTHQHAYVLLVEAVPEVHAWFGNPSQGG